MNIFSKLAQKLIDIIKPKASNRVLSMNAVSMGSASKLTLGHKGPNFEEGRHMQKG